MKKAVTVLLVLLLVFGSTAQAFAQYETVYANKPVTLGSGGWIDEEGGLWLWGLNNYGQAGQDPSDYYVAEPAKVMDHVVAFSRCKDAIIVLKDDGTAWTFGQDFQHGYKRYTAHSFTIAGGMEPYKAGDNVVAVSVGNDREFAMLKKDGTLWTWGKENWKSLGYYTGDLDDEYYMIDGWTYSNGLGFGMRVGTTKPIQIMTNVKAMTMGHYMGMALKNNGELWYWGDNCDAVSYSERSSEIPGPTKLMDNVKQFSLGSGGSIYCAVVLTNGQAWYWGYDTAAGDVRYKNRKKIGDNVEKVVSYSEYETIFHSTSADSAHGNQFYVLKTDGKLYGKNGSQYIMDDVADVYVCSGNVTYIPEPYAVGEDDSRERAYILKKDGTLIERRCIQNDDGTFSKWTYKTIAQHVALPTQAISTMRKKIGNFVDVREGDWFAGPVEWAVERSITAGTSPTTFSPNQTCTTAQILTFLWVAAGQEQPKEDNPFSDVVESNYFYRPALWASENGLVEGDIFGGDMPCTRAAVVTYLWKLAGSPEAGSSQFKDVPADAEYAQAVAWAVKEGVTAGLSADTFGPDNICTRAQIVTFLKAALDH